MKSINNINTLPGWVNWDGPILPRLTHQWYHVCASVRYANGGAQRTIVADGKIFYNHTTKYVANATWPKGHNFTFGGRELLYAGISFI